jgi:hypothetical protein
MKRDEKEEENGEKNNKLFYFIIPDEFMWSKQKYF